MALLFCDGFGHVDDDHELLKWGNYYSGTSIEMGSGYGRLGDWGACLIISDTHWIHKYFAAKTNIITGLAQRIGLGSDEKILSFTDGSNEQVTVWMHPTGSITVYRDDSDALLGSSDAGVVASNAWGYIEVKILFSHTVGTVEVRYNGVTVINETGLDTCDTVNEHCEGVKIHGGVRYIDDFYICDTSGSLNNDFLGDIHIKTLYPVTDGTYTDFTPSTGTDHYALVDEPQLSADTDHNESSTIGHKDSYDVTTITGADTILGVQICGAVKNTDTGTMNVRTICRSGGTPVDNEGPDFALSQTIQGAITIHEQEPTDTVAWTQAKINAAEFGLKVQS